MNICYFTCSKKYGGLEKVTVDISNKNILIIDDVITTGATVLEISKALYDKGAKSVKCFTISKKFLYDR